MDLPPSSSPGRGLSDVLRCQNARIKTPHDGVRGRPARLLVASHEGSQSGAPSVLVNLLEWLSSHTDVSIHTLLVEDGPLRSRFEAVGSVSAVDDRLGASTLGLIERGLVAHRNLLARRIPAAMRYVPALARLGRFDIVYLNSISTLDLLPYLRDAPLVLVHIHEGPLTVSQWWQSYGPVSPKRRPDRWVAVSDDTAAAIKDLPGVRPGQVVTHHPFIDVAFARAQEPSPVELADLRARLGIPPGAAVVVGSGSIDRRKGPDLFVQLANAMGREGTTNHRQVHFLWVGGDLSGLDWPLMRADIDRAGTANVHVTGHVDDPRPYYRLADVFALTSREDPFPLVCLEHAALGVPVVAYSSSGIRELLLAAGPDAARGVVRYLDVTAMAQRIAELLSSPELTHRAGEQLGHRVQTHHDTSTAAPELARELRLIG